MLGFGVADFSQLLEPGSAPPRFLGAARMVMEVPTNGTSGTPWTNSEWLGSRRVSHVAAIR